MNTNKNRDQNIVKEYATISFLTVFILLLIFGIIFSVSAYKILHFVLFEMVVEDTYPTYADAIERDMDHRGWIQDFVPASAVDIRDWHDLDINRQHLRVHFAKEDLSSMLKKLTPIPAETMQFSNFRKAWWPEALRKYSEGLDDTYDFYTFDSITTYGSGQQEINTYYIAIDTNACMLWSYLP